MPKERSFQDRLALELLDTQLVRTPRRISHEELAGLLGHGSVREIEVISGINNGRDYDTVAKLERAYENGGEKK